MKLGNPLKLKEFEVPGKDPFWMWKGDVSKYLFEAKKGHKNGPFWG